MELPFSDSEFLDLFGSYNSALWPLAAALWLLTAGLVMNWTYTGRIGSRSMFVLLASHWAVSGIAYHWYFFRRINSAATLFAVLFLAQSALFVWLALASHRHFSLERNLRGAISGALVAYALVYPGLGIVLGLEYPRLPLFGVPCPTTLLTAGLLVASSGTPRIACLVPIIWAGVGGSAAFVLGMRADLALVAAGVLLTLDTLSPSALGPRAGV